MSTIMEDSPQPMSIKERIAAMKLEELGRIPHSPTTNDNRPHAPLKPPRPGLQPRPRSVSGVIDQQIGNTPAAANNNDILPPNGRTNSSGSTHGGAVVHPSPPLPPRRPSEQTTRPLLPARRPSEQAPCLPPRRPSEQSVVLARRGSADSTSSGISALSSASSTTGRISNSSRPINGVARGGLAPVYDPSKLPPLPPKRATQEKARGISRSRSPNAQYAATRVERDRSPVEIPPGLPARRESHAVETPPVLFPRRESYANGVPQSKPRPSALSYGLNKGTETPPTLPAIRPASVLGIVPAPVDNLPLSARPDLSKLLASKPKPSNSTTPSPAHSQTASSCLKCRDFSSPDAHAARFPRSTLPSQDIAWLAHQLTDPFPSATDKARAIFTWLHHNVSYDVDAFFSHNIQSSTPNSTLSSGLAVCEGYAALYAALATKVGLPALVVSGHGKGYGHTTLAPGAPLPSFDSNHAWTAVQINNGEWKLLDACWGAGNVHGPGQPYEKSFHPALFTMSNDEFGLKHYPTDPAHFYRNDGRRSITWAEYCVGDPEIARLGGYADAYGASAAAHGLSETGFVPRAKRIAVAEQSGRVVRFAFEKVCPHWDPRVHGQGDPYLFVMCVEGREAGKKEYRSFESDGQGWWCDVGMEDVGRSRGKGVQCYAVTKWNGKDGRGLTGREFEEGRRPGRAFSMAFEGVAAWEVV